MSYEDLIGDIDEFAAAFEYWINAYSKRGDEIVRLEDKVYSLEHDLEEARADIDQLEEQLKAYQYQAGVA